MINNRGLTYNTWEVMYSSPSYTSIPLGNLTRNGKNNSGNYYYNINKKEM